jgi:hypothetical protein
MIDADHRPELDIEATFRLTYISGKSNNITLFTDSAVNMESQAFAWLSEAMPDADVMNISLVNWKMLQAEDRVWGLRFVDVPSALFSHCLVDDGATPFFDADGVECLLADPDDVLSLSVIPFIARTFSEELQMLAHLAKTTELFILRSVE